MISPVVETNEKLFGKWDDEASAELPTSFWKFKELQ